MYTNQLLTLPLNDELFIGQFLRTLAASYNGCGDIGECFATAAGTADHDFDLFEQRVFDRMDRIVRR